MIEIKKPEQIKLKGNQLLITLNRYEDDFKTKNGVVVYKKGMMKYYQKVVAIGSVVDRMGEIKVGDTVILNANSFARIAHSWEEEEIKQQNKDLGNDKVSNVNAVKDKLSMIYKFDEIDIDGKMYAFIYDSDIKCGIDNPEELEYAPDRIG